MSRSCRGGSARGALVLAVSLVVASGPALGSVQSELAFHRGVEDFGAKRFDDARAEFERVLAEDPKDAASLRYLGLIASEQKDPAGAVEQYRKALAITPDDPDLRFDLGTALLEAERPADALPEFEAVVAAQPQRARAHLLAGIARYRMRQYDAAQASLEKSVELDPGLGVEANYYLGLTRSYLGDFSGATRALGVAEDQSPGSHIGRSAAVLRERLEPRAAEHRRWSLALTSGMEFDSNPRVLGQTFVNRHSDGRGVFRLRGDVLAIDTEHFELRGGYDGYLSLHFDQTDVDVQSHDGWVQGTYRLDPVRMSLRYDYGYTFLDINHDYQSLHRLTPSVHVNEGRWGVSEVFYQHMYGYFFFEDFNPALDQDGPYNAAGVNQFFFPEGIGALSRASQLVQYVRVGGLFDTYNPQGEEFRSDGFELSLGFGLSLPWRISLTGDYRYLHQNYHNESVFDPTTKRDDDIQVVSVELVRPINEHLEVSVYGFYRNNASNVQIYDYDRVIAGGYLTYHF